MYKIIGADGKEYGPISVDVLKKWIVEGRANAQTKVLPEGATEWLTVAQIPELTTTISASPPPAQFLAVPHSGPSIAAQVNGPAIGLIVIAIVQILGTTFGLLWNIFFTGVNLYQTGLDPEVQKIAALFSGTVGFVSGAIGFIVAGLILFGALRMRKLQNYGWAKAVSILAMLPSVFPCLVSCCLLPCGFVGLPIGIWALVVLSKPEVKTAFH